MTNQEPAEKQSSPIREAGEIGKTISTEVGTRMLGPTIKSSFSKLLSKGGKLIGPLLKTIGITSKAATAIPVVGQAIGTLSFVFSALKPIVKKIFPKLAIFLKQKGDISGFLGSLALLLVGIFGRLPIIIATPLVVVGGIGVAATGLSGLASAFSGAASGLGGAINASLSSAHNFLLYLYESLSPFSFAAEMSAVGVVGSVTVAGLITIPALLAAFYVPSVSRPSPWAQNSQYIQVSKTVRFSDIPDAVELENDQITDETTFTYEVIITANGADLKDIQLNDIITSSQENGAFTVNPQLPQIPSFLADGSSSPPITYTITTFPRTEFTDSILSNIAIVNATAVVTQPDGSTQEAPNQQSTAETTIIIGEPPQNCPSGWPVAGNPTVSAGPGSIDTHLGNHYESIDLVVNTGTPVFATHNGTVKNAGYQSDGYGNFVEIEGICNGIVFSSLYAHLLDFSVAIGQPISAGQQIGLSDNTGKSTGAHLHYEFKDRKLRITDYTPY